MFDRYVASYVEQRRHRIRVRSFPRDPIRFQPRAESIRRPRLRDGGDAPHRTRASPRYLLRDRRLGTELPVTVLFEELDLELDTDGRISLRRRLEPTLQVEVYEAKLGDEYLMSSLFTDRDRARQHRHWPCSRARISTSWSVGSGSAIPHTPSWRRPGGVAGRRRALARSSGGTSVDCFRSVAVLTSDRRCHLVNGDFFVDGRRRCGSGRAPAGRHDAILLDVDHSPRHLLHPSHAPFYKPEGLRRLAGRLHPGGNSAPWSDDTPDDDYVAALEGVSASCDAHVVTFPNPYTGGEGPAPCTSRPRVASVSRERREVALDSS